MGSVNLRTAFNCTCGLHKAEAVQTVVGKYVEDKQPKVSRKAARVLKEYGNTIAKQVAELYGKKVPAEKLAKADDTDAIVQSILDELELNDIAVDVVDSITPELIRAYKQAGITGVGRIGITASRDIVDHMDKAALEYAGSHGAELVSSLEDTTREALRDRIADAIEQGLSADELSTSIEESGAFSESRADAIARTELATAHVQGNIEGWRETGQVTGKQWILGDTHPGEDECDDNAADGVIGIDEAFSSGVFAPPAHTNCLCDLIPIMEGE